MLNFNVKIVFFVFALHFICVCLAMPEADNSTNNDNKTTHQKKPTFRYFGYGSNLLAKRLQIQNPTAVRVEPGLLKVKI